MQRYLKQNWSLIFAIIIGLALIAPAVISAQAVASLNGRAVDQQGGVLPGVSLTLRSEETGFVRESITSENGAFAFTGLAPGLFQIQAELPGFKKYQLTNIRLEIGKTQVIEVTLEVGAIADEIQVTAEAPLVDTTSREIGGTIVTQELAELPSINRNFNTYVALLPGVVYNPNANFGADSVQMGGQAGGQTLYMMDGAANNDDQRGGNSGAQVRVPLDAIQEFQVLVGQFDAEYTGSGGVVNAVSKQGTNEFHGTAFTLIRDSDLTEKSYFVKRNNLAKPQASEHQFGGTFGGPIVQNKAHFFGSVERVILKQGITFNVPDRPDLNATFSQPAKVWNVLGRVDYQVNTQHTMGFRWLSEWSPQLLYGTNRTAAAVQTEEDNDRTYIGTLTSALSPTTLNTLKFTAVLEDYLDASQAFKDNGKRQDRLLPTLAFQNFTDQQLATSTEPSNHTYALSESLAWFVPELAGSHNFKLGGEASYLGLRAINQGNMNGTFSFSSSNQPFNPANPRTYPDRLTIRVPSETRRLDRGVYWAAYIQDKWQPVSGLTLSLGLRYDREIMSVDEKNNPNFADPGDYPVDKNNFAPRAGFAYTIGSDAHTVLRGGWGLFFQRMQFGTINGYSTQGAFSDSFTASFPSDNIDNGPSTGQFPTDPMLAWVRTNGLTINRALLNQLYPAGSQLKNTGTVRLDDPNRRNPNNHQLSFGIQQQIGATMALSADYTGTFTRGLIVLKDLNPGLRISTNRNARIDRVNPNYVTSVTTPLNLGYQDYNALQLSLEKRFRSGYSYRASYTLAKGWGNVAGNDATVSTQLLDDLRLDQNEGYSTVDRRHNLTLSGTLDVPKTGGLRVSMVAKASSGGNFTITDSTTDPDRNGILTDYLPAGTYTGEGPLGITVENHSGRNGAYGPNRIQLDGRFGYNFALGENKKLEVYSELLNVTNYTSFSNPSGDRRTANTFLVLTGTTGVPRSIQFGARFAF